MVIGERANYRVKMIPEMILEKAHGMEIFTS